MARHRGLLERLSLAPWWLGFSAAVIVYLTAMYIAPAVHPAFATASHFAPLYAAPFLMVSAAALLNQYKRKSLLDAQSGIESIRNLSWQEFELLVGEAFRRQGYVIEEIGGGGADGGVDLNLRRDGKAYVVQCKHWKARQVGVSPVRELLGVMTAAKADGGIFVSSGTYTSEASRFGTENGLTLIDGTSLLQMIRGVQSSSEKEVPPSGEELARPVCPSCGGEMIERQARRGPSVGKTFWGCVAFPKCKGTVSIPNT